MNSTPDYDAWWEEEHPDGTSSLEIESDADECLKDSYQDVDLY